LDAMSGQLDVALKSNRPESVDLAAKKADLVGKTVRSTQSAARAVETSAATGRKIRANAKQPAVAADDRAALTAELDRIASKIPT
jgi:hypothetical protein